MEYAYMNLQKLSYILAWFILGNSIILHSSRDIIKFRFKQISLDHKFSNHFWITSIIKPFLKSKKEIYLPSKATDGIGLTSI